MAERRGKMFKGLFTADKVNHILTLMNTLKNVVDSVKETGKVAGEVMPPIFKQRLPKMFGFTLEDEQIFNGVLCQLTPGDQALITAFLAKCKDYEQVRFINVVAGMTYEKEVKGTTEEKFDKKTKNVYWKKETGGLPGKDRREEFLRSFAKVIRLKFNGNHEKAYEYCVAGRMIIPNPLHQKILEKWSRSCKWFRNIMLKPFGVETVKELQKIVTKHCETNAEDLVSSTEALKNKAKAWRDAAGSRSTRIIIVNRYTQIHKNIGG